MDFTHKQDRRLAKGSNQHISSGMTFGGQMTHVRGKIYGRGMCVFTEMASSEKVWNVIFGASAEFQQCLEP